MISILFKIIIIIILAIIIQSQCSDLYFEHDIITAQLCLVHNGLVQHSHHCHCQ